MTQMDLNNEWAWTQIEAMADESLHGPSLARMQQAMSADPQLDAAVARARAVRRALGRVSQPRARGALLWRLLALPNAPERSHRAAFFGWTAAGGAVAAAVLAGVAITLNVDPPAPPPPDPRTAAIQELELALYYLRKSAATTGDEVNAALGNGLRDALIVSRDSLRDRETRQETGG